MMEAIEGVTMQLALMALDAYALRHEVIASNIANHASADYSPQGVDFESLLGPLRAAVHSNQSELLISEQMSDVAARVAVVPTGAAEVQLDEEMSALAVNTLKYQALVSALGRMTALDRMAIRGDIR
jgi:flagellar basal-body rod protein FlgB